MEGGSLDKLMALFTRKVQIDRFQPEITHEQAIIRAKLAKDILENNLFQSIFKEIEEELFTMWRNSTPMQARERESIWHRLEALREVELKLRGVFNEAAIEEQKITEGKE